jgi:hypothetical protein
MSELSLLSEVNRTSRLRPPTSEFDPERPSAPAVIPTSARIVIGLATVIQPRRFDQDVLVCQTAVLLG